MIALTASLAGRGSVLRGAQGKRAAVLSDAALDLLTKRRSSGFGHILVILFDRTRILALGVDVAIDEFDDRDRCRVRSADAGLDHAGLTAVAILVAFGEDAEQLHQLRFTHQWRHREAQLNGK